MINFISCKCPECDSDLSIESSRDTAFCTYCGAKILINNENEHVYRYIDESEIKKSEAEVTKLQIEGDSREAERKHKLKVYIIMFSFLAFLCLMGLIASYLGL